MSARQPHPELYLGSITTGSGVDLRSHEGQVAFVRAVLGIKPAPTVTPSAQASGQAEPRKAGNA